MPTHRTPQEVYFRTNRAADGSTVNVNSAPWVRLANATELSNYLPLTGGQLTTYNEQDIEWVLNLKNTHNTFDTTYNYGVGVKFSNGGPSETTK